MTSKCSLFHDNTNLFWNAKTKTFFERTMKESQGYMVLSVMLEIYTVMLGRYNLNVSCIPLHQNNEYTKGNLLFIIVKNLSQSITVSSQFIAEENYIYILDKECKTLFYISCVMLALSTIESYSVRIICLPLVTSCPESY